MAATTQTRMLRSFFSNESKIVQNEDETMLILWCSLLQPQSAIHVSKIKWVRQHNRRFCTLVTVERNLVAAKIFCRY